MNNRRKKKVGIPFRTLIALLSVALLFGGAIGGTVAWLTSASGEVVNTFTVGDIEIKLDEAKVDEYGNFVDASGKTVDEDGNPHTIDEAARVATNSYKIIPGNDYSKDPKITFTKDSEICYLFVTITKSANYDTFLEEYAVDTNKWTKYDDDNTLSDNVAVYYRELTTADAVKNGTEYYILKCCDDTNHGDSHTNGCVVVKTAPTKEQISAIVPGEEPTLTFKACAVQHDNLELKDAWTQAKAKLINNTPNP